MTPLDPGAWARRFTDPALFVHEQSRLGAAWTLLGLTGDVHREGDWFRATLGGRSVFVQRFDDQLRGFENVCAHRFFPLRTEDRGNGPIRCGFHHWQYNKEGKATGIPKCKEMFGVGPREVGAQLAPVEIATCGSLVFGRFPDGEHTESLEQYLGVGYAILNAMTRVDRVRPPRVSSIAANWKLGYHISLDDYHLAAVHPNTLGRGGYLNADAVRYYRFGNHSAYFNGDDDGDLGEMSAACANGTYRPSAYRIFQCFPNLVVSHAVTTIGNYYIFVQQYVPVAVDRTVLRSWAFPAPFPRVYGGLWERLVQVVTAPLLPLLVPIQTQKIVSEDNAACERLQTVAGQATGRPRLGRHEERIGWFEETYDAWVNGDATEGATQP